MNTASISATSLPEALLKDWRRFVLIPLLAGALGAGASFLVKPTFTSATTFLPPQQQQSSAAASLASLGALASLAGGMAGIKSPADQYVSLMMSVTASDRIIDKFKLMEVYDVRYRVEAREELADRVRIALGKKDGLITVAVEDHDPERAAAMASQYVEELRSMTAALVLTEAQQRRAFFEKQLQTASKALEKTQTALQESGFGSASLKAEPKATAETYARLRAELTAAEVKLQTMKSALADQAPEIRVQLGTVQALRQQLAQIESEAGKQSSGGEYIARYREFKYQEALFELMARQYEMARLDESREGGLIQVIDEARPAEKKTRPRRALIALGCSLVTGIAMVVHLIWRRRQAGDEAAVL